MAYQTYYEYRTCAKCGSDRREVAYHAEHHDNFHPVDSLCGTLTFDHMLVRCERCGRGVVELPLDAEP